MHFGVLSTVTPKGHAHSTGILYAVSPPETPFSIYVMTGEKYRKTRNITKNPSVAFVVPFPHHFLRFVPSSCVQFQGWAEVLPIDHPGGRESFQSSMILRKSLEAEELVAEEKAVFVRIKPAGKLSVYGLGYSLLEMSRNVTGVSYSVAIPPSRR